MSQDITLIINPSAGKGMAKTYLYDILAEFCHAGYRTSVYITEKPGDATRYASVHGTDAPLLVCVGGDGTLSEVVSGLMPMDRELRPNIGYIPLGTANDVASSLKLARQPKIAAKNIIHGKPTPIDIGRFGNAYFSYIAAFGAFTEVSYSTPQESKRALGHLAYVLEGMASLPKITTEHVLVEYDDGSVEGDYVFGSVSNSTSVAGIVKLRPDDVSLSDGMFEIVLVKMPTNIADFNNMATNLLAQNLEVDNIFFLHSKKVKFTFSEEVAWTRDGENGGTLKSVEVENCHHALTYIV